MVDYISDRGGEVRLNALKSCLTLMAQLGVPNWGLNKAEDEVLTADLYVSAMPVDPLKAMLPERGNRWNTSKNLRVCQCR